MSWVYKLKSMEREAPIFTYYRDLTMFNRVDLENIRITPTAAALNYWLIYERNDLPIGITQLSFDSFTKPIAKDGTLPVTLFGRPLNFKRIKEKGIKWLLCYAEEDDLVDRDAALAPADFIDVEVTVFPRGTAPLPRPGPCRPPSAPCTGASKTDTADPSVTSLTSTA